MLVQVKYLIKAWYKKHKAWIHYWIVHYYYYGLQFSFPWTLMKQYEEEVMMVQQ